MLQTQFGAFGRDPTANCGPVKDPQFKHAWEMQGPPAPRACKLDENLLRSIRCRTNFRTVAWMCENSRASAEARWQQCRLRGIMINFQRLPTSTSTETRSRPGRDSDHACGDERWPSSKLKLIPTTWALTSNCRPVQRLRFEPPRDCRYHHPNLAFLRGRNIYSSHFVTRRQG